MSLPPTDGLFFALFPPAPVANHIRKIADKWTEQHGFFFRPMPAHRYHITLSHLGNYWGGVPEDVVMAASTASDALTFSSFKVILDRVGSFKRGAATKPLVLRGGGPALMDFQSLLRNELDKALFWRKPRKSFTPHVTLLYAPALVDEQPIEPISWMATEFVLVHSLLGQTRHIPLGRWPLHD